MSSNPNYCGKPRVQNESFHKRYALTIHLAAKSASLTDVELLPSTRYHMMLVTNVSAVSVLLVGQRLQNELNDIMSWNHVMLVTSDMLFPSWPLSRPDTPSSLLMSEHLQNALSVHFSPAPKISTNSPDTKFVNVRNKT